MTIVTERSRYEDMNSNLIVVFPALGVTSPEPMPASARQGENGNPSNPAAPETKHLTAIRITFAYVAASSKPRFRGMPHKRANGGSNCDRGAHQPEAERTEVL